MSMSRPSVSVATVDAGRKEAERLLHTVEHGVAGLDALLASLIRAAAADGQAVKPTAALRVWAERVQGRLRAARR